MFTVYQLQQLKEALEAHDPSQQELLAKIWVMQGDLIKTMIEECA
jgi:hypothetical protein